MSDPSAVPERAAPPPRRADAAFLISHPAHWVALGFGSGLAPRAPGTAGTLWAWVVFLILARWLDPRAWAPVLGASFAIGWWACTRTARDLGQRDPAAVVWDEVLAFWIVLWAITPAGLIEQAVAFALFRGFDAIKRGPVGWADRCFKGAPGTPIGWRDGFGIVFDDLVAALCTLLVIYVWKTLFGSTLR